jgi:hypothetical protein
MKRGNTIPLAGLRWKPVFALKRLDGTPCLRKKGEKRIFSGGLTSSKSISGRSCYSTSMAKQWKLIVIPSFFSN